MRLKQSHDTAVVCFKNMLGHQVHERILHLEKESIKSNPYRFSYFKFSYELNIENSMPRVVLNII